MKPLSSLASQFRSIRTAVGLVLTVSLPILGAVLLLHWWRGIPIGHLTRDPATITGAPTYTGLLSNIGILLWSAAAALCLFSATLVARRRSEWLFAQFLYASGLFTLLVSIDDLFLLHDSFFPTHIGIPEKVIYGAYALLALVYLLRFGAVILETEYLLLGLALFLFGLSVALDVLPPFPFGDPYLLEDGAKFAGIVTWLVYFTRVSSQAIQRGRTDHRDPRGERYRAEPR